ncbi:MAG: hypothetical protein CSA18_03350 [Deltaproteobacteria bacterium]|nr:MAG: hypothetical protein CSA18_03350 [Deltaproteobacteria bacterium]
MNNNKGFSLVELLIVMLITAVVSTVLYSTFNNEIKTFVNQKKINGLRRDVMLTLFFIKKDLALAGFDPFGGADVGFNEISEKKMTFTGVDINKLSLGSGDNKCLRRYRYEFNKANSGDITGKIQRLSGATTTGSFSHIILNGNELSDNIEDFKLEYLDSGDAITSDMDNVRAVKITIKGRLGLWGRPDFKETFSIQYNCRNMGV